MANLTTLPNCVPPTQMTGLPSGSMTCTLLLSVIRAQRSDLPRPHDGWLKMAEPFIKAFKAGASSPDMFISSDQLIYWYRPTLRNQDCDATDTCMASSGNTAGNYFTGRPDGWEFMQDSVFVVSLLQSPAIVQINSGGGLHHYTAPAGAFAQAVPMGSGPQSFSIHRNGQTVLAGTSLKDIIDGCVCGLYNFNAYGKPLPNNYPLST